MSKKITHKLSDSIPIYTVEKGISITKTLCLSAHIELTMPEAYSLSEVELLTMYNLFNQIIKALPKGYVLHKQDYYTEEYYQRDSNNDSFLAKAYEQKFNERFFLGHRSYLYISKARNDAPGNNIMTAIAMFFKGRLIDRELLESVPDFRNTVDKIVHILEAGGIPCSVLRDKEIINLFNRYYNLGDSRILKDISTQKDHLEIGSQDVVMYNSVAYEIELPKEVETDLNINTYFDNSFTFNLGIGYSRPHIVNTIIRKKDQSSLIKELSARREQTLSLSFKSRENQMLVDEFDHYLSDIIKTGEAPIYLSQNVTIYGKDKDLAKAENQLNTVLGSMNIFAQRNFNCVNSFWACCPGNAGALSESEYQIQFSNLAATFFPIESNPKNTGINGIKLSERTYHKPIIVDLWDAPKESGDITNRNMFILGPSGSGKSFLTNHIVRQLLDQGYHITIIDVGGSYERLCHYKKGEYFEYQEDNKMSFNPFFVPIVNGKYVVRNIEEQESLKTLIFTLWKGEEGARSKEEYTTLANSLEAYFQHIQEKELKSNFNAYYAFMRDDVVRVLGKEEFEFFNMNSFLHVLKPYYKGGSYDYLLNSEKEFSIADLPFCVFELDNVKNNPIIFPVIALVIMDAFIAKMRRYKQIKKIILIEEAWSAMANKGMAHFLKYLYKTVRKFNGAVGIITQEIEDIIANDFVKNTIINNADIQILLDQTKYQNRLGDLKQALGLKDIEIKKLLSLNKIPLPNEKSKDVYIRLGLKGKAYAVSVSPEEAIMYSTDAEVSTEINALIKEFNGDYDYAIQVYLERQEAKTINLNTKKTLALQSA